MSMLMDEVTYVCAQCGAEDKLAVELDEQPWPAMARHGLLEVWSRSWHSVSC